MKIESIRSNNFYSFQSYLFQDLREKFEERNSKVLPRVLLDLNSKAQNNNFNYNTNIELANIIRTNGNETKKIFLQQTFEFPKFFSDGTFINLEFI